MGWLCATSAWILLRIGCPVARAAAAAGVVGVRGFEPPAPASRTQCSTRLSYTPAEPRHIALAAASDKAALQARRLAPCCRPERTQPAKHARHAVDDFVKGADLRSCESVRDCGLQGG